MLHFRTILICLAFLTLLISRYVYFSDYNLNLVLNFAPTVLLILWFLSSIFIHKKYEIDKNKINKTSYKALILVKNLANFSIVLGALFELMHWTGGTQLLITGLGFLSFWSIFISLTFKEKYENDPNIVDDMEDLE